MATRIIEYAGADRSDGLPVIPFSTVVQTPITASGTSQQSAAFGLSTNLICISTDEAVHVHRGASPTATTSHIEVPAQTFAFFSVKAGEKVAILLGA